MPKPVATTASDSDFYLPADRFFAANLPSALTYDDVSLATLHSEILPKDTDLATTLAEGLRLQIPIISSDMDTVTESRMAIAMALNGGLGLIHYNMPAKEQVKEVARVKRHIHGLIQDPITVSPTQLIGDVLAMIDAKRFAFSTFPVVDAAGCLVGLLSGNVATRSGAHALVDAGADAIKVGVGPGSICTTRVVAGVGVPQVTAVYEASLAARETGIPVIADGGLQYSGDIAKALVAGADTVMLGSLLAGTDEAPGDLVYANGKQFKNYRGMGSLGALSDRGKKTSYSRDRYFQADVPSDAQLIPEGIEGRVPYRGALGATVYQLVGGLRQSMFYVGARTIPELKARGKFVRITPAGLKESHPHDIQMTVEAPNYSR
jgi:IMP dehydrogenase